jgi:pyruvate-ferredoxin/flavodoxin oxidoreductase
MRLALDQQKEYAEDLLKRLAPTVGDELVAALLTASQAKESEINAQRERVLALRGKLAGVDSLEARALLTVADSLVRKSVWVWAATAGPTTSASAA